VLYGCGLGSSECERRVLSLMRGEVGGIVSRVSRSEGSESGSGSGSVLGEKLSGGERQITNIISGVISESSVLILDEPTTGLDVELKRGVLEMIEEEKEKKCIIIISHDKEVFRLFDETIWV
jgi:ABC-type glutathione transport system ATPase component